MSLSPFGVVKSQRRRSLSHLTDDDDCDPMAAVADSLPFKRFNKRTLDLTGYSLSKAESVERGSGNRRDSPIFKNYSEL
jgi:hypothetical protein